jgi:hypothetical protein
LENVTKIKSRWIIDQGEEKARTEKPDLLRQTDQVCTVEQRKPERVLVDAPFGKIKI